MGSKSTGFCLAASMARILNYVAFYAVGNFLHSMNPHNKGQRMSKPKKPRKLIRFDAARYLNDDAAIAEYMSAILETEDSDLLLLALNDVSRARERPNDGKFALGK
jgi:hypothetical protein